LIDHECGRTVAAASKEHHATVPGLASRCDEQRVDVLLDTVWAVLRELGPTVLARTRAVGVTGQMHGVVVLGSEGQPLTNLITWQDQRCDTAFLDALHRATGIRGLRTGFGAASLAWLRKNRLLPDNAAATAAIHDHVVQRLCGLSRPVTDPTDAASWGLFDRRTGTWRTEAWIACGIRPELLPRVRPCGDCAGRICPNTAAATGLPVGTPVAVALGDNQASLLAALHDRTPERVLALTLGTGGQLSAVMPADFDPPEPPEDAAFEYRPFPGRRVAAVAAALCGGSSFAWLVTTVRTWCRELGLPIPAEGALYELLDRLGQDADGGGLEVSPRFLGERHVPEDRAWIKGIARTNFTPANLARALAVGTVRNLKEMLPTACFEGRDRVVGSGNAIRRLRLLQQAASETLGLPLEISAMREEAAVGAALLAKPLARRPRRNDPGPS